MSPRLDVAACTHPGLARANNEDAILVDIRRGRFAVVDGMGGCPAGARAAQLTVTALRTEGELSVDLMSAATAIAEDVALHPNRRGMGCVATAAQLRAGSVEIAHIGDTRAWVTSHRGVRRLTTDHARGSTDGGPSGALVRAVTRDLGVPHPEVDVSTSPMSTGDLLLLCSDGLGEVISDAELVVILAAAHQNREPAAGITALLLGLALQRGAPDNVSVVVVTRRGDHRSDSRALRLLVALLLSLVFASQEPTADHGYPPSSSFCFTGAVGACTIDSFQPRLP